MDAGYHLMLSTRPFVSASTGDSENVDLIWNNLSRLSDGSAARGRRKHWGCDTTVSWLEHELIPMLINLYWPVIRNAIQRILGLPAEPTYRPNPKDLFYIQKANDWTNTPIHSVSSLNALVSDLQDHYSLHSMGAFRGDHALAIDKALFAVLKAALDPYCFSIASNADLCTSGCTSAGKDDLLRELQYRLRGKNPASTSGLLLDFRLRAILTALQTTDDANLSGAECQAVADFLRPLVDSATLYNRFRAHRLTVAK